MLKCAGTHPKQHESAPKAHGKQRPKHHTEPKTKPKTQTDHSPSNSKKNFTAHTNPPSKPKLFYYKQSNVNMVKHTMATPEAMKGVGETIATLIDKLAGKGTNVQLTFKDLTLEMAGMKTKLNGSVTLDVTYVSEKK
jgi:hypothetical protein